MELVYPRQLEAEGTVLGKWTPDTTGGMVAYRLWSAVGVPVVGLLYPLVLFGYVLRYQARRLDTAVARIGVLGVVLVSVVVWGLLTVLAEVQFDMSAEGVVAVLAAGIVATISAALSVVTRRVGGRATTILLSYPLAVTAIFLPPVVAALYSQWVATVVFPRSTSLAAWLLDNVLVIGGLGEYLRRGYDLTGVAYVGMWFGLAVPVGWLLGLLVTLADYVRPGD